MSALKRKKRPLQSLEVKSTNKHKWPTALAVLICAAVAVAIGVLFFSGKKTDSGTPARASAKGTSSPTELSTQTKHDFQKLTGRWLRPDGGYIIEIRSVDKRGGLDATYLNPRPINVSRAEAFKQGLMTKVFIELQDVGYPGSTYTLIFDAQRDALMGVYYQAQIDQSFDVMFVRMK